MTKWKKQRCLKWLYWDHNAYLPANLIQDALAEAVW